MNKVKDRRSNRTKNAEKEKELQQREEISEDKESATSIRHILNSERKYQGATVRGNISKTYPRVVMISLTPLCFTLIATSLLVQKPAPEKEVSVFVCWQLEFGVWGRSYGKVLRECRKKGGNNKKRERGRNNLEKPRRESDCTFRR